MNHQIFFTLITTLFLSTTTQSADYGVSNNNFGESSSSLRQQQQFPSGHRDDYLHTFNLPADYSDSVNVEDDDSLQLLPRRRYRRQLDDETRPLSTSSLTCDFGSAPTPEFCSWSVPEDSHPNVRWKTGSGTTAYWLGGPLVDKTADDANGGYVYFETSYKNINRVVSSAALESGIQSGDLRIQIVPPSDSSGRTADGDHKDNSSSSSGIGTSGSSPSVYKSGLSVSTIDDSLSNLLVTPNTAALLSTNISVTGSQGNCLTFYYNLDGLSAEKLRVLVKDLDADMTQNQTLWESTIESEGKWIKASVAYAYETTHQLIMEGVAKSVDEPERAYRGFVAVDDVSLQPMSEGGDACHGHCTFEGGMCGWTNQEEGDDFDWSLARGSDNFFTGPARDFYSFSREYPLGGFVYIDSSFPRRPGDRAILVSPTFEPTADTPVCFKFATHMFGNGVGSLRVWIRPAEGGSEEVAKQSKILWEMSGDSGNNWNQAQLPIASATQFQIAFEGIVGNNYLGNIAIDSISVEPGSCPISPQTASRKSGDCTFEENMCFWSNPGKDTNLDDFDWIRQFSYGNFGPKRDHSRRSELGYFMSLNGDSTTPKRGGTNAWLISGEFPASTTHKKCMQFYYFMYQRIIDPGGPSLGGLRVYIRTTDASNNIILIPVWRLNNHQSMKWRRASVTLAVPDDQAEVGAVSRTKPPPNPYQVVIEGIWGDTRVGSIAVDDISFVEGDCTTQPNNAVAVDGECSFDKNLCGWKNLTKTSSLPNPLSGSNNKISSSPLLTPKVSSGTATSARSSNDHPLAHKLNNNEAAAWRLASPNSRPSNLQDHTFRAPIGYIFFDVFNQNQIQMPILRSKKFPAKEGEVNTKCLSFWFSPFGRSEVTQLSVFQTVEGSTGDADIGEGAAGGGAAGVPATSTGEGQGKKVLLWQIQTRKFDTRRPQWYYGQTTVNAATPHEISFEGEALDGGFAIDDITFYGGTCQTRPTDATVVSKTEE